MTPLTIQSEALALQGYAPETVIVDLGQTIEGMLRQALGVRALGETLRGELTVSVAGQVVPMAWWDKLRPKAGVPVYVAHRGLKGGNGGDILRLAAVAVLTYFTFGAGGIAGGSFLGLSGFSGYAAATGAFMLGSLAINALVPVTNTGGSSPGSEGNWRQLTGNSNQLDQWGVISFVAGEYRIYPKKAAITYTEVVGEESWIRMLLDLGYDIEPDDVESLRLGDTPVSDFADIEYEITTTPTLYTSDVFEESVGVTMDDEGDRVQRTTSPNVTSISLDLIYAAGLFGVGNSGKKFTLYTKWDVEYCATGTDDWVKPTSPRLAGMSYNGISDTYDVNAQNQKPFAVGLAWDVPGGQYDVRVTRVESGSSTGGGGNTYVESATYSVLRSIKNVVPSTTGTTKLAMRLKTSDDLTGSVDSVNCLLRPKIPVYDRATGAWTVRRSLNPSWVVYWLMTACKGLSKHVPASRMDLEAWADYAEFCDTHGFEARAVCDSGTTAKPFINRILGGALASLGEQGGKYRPVFDEGASDAEWTYTALEVTSFKVSRVFTDLPQALRVQFVNPDAGYANDEIIVLRDGYSYRGVDARGNASSAPEPAEFETLQLQLAMKPQQGWRLGRYHFAQAEFRPNTYNVALDIAGLPARRGALVAVPHDVIDGCVGVGRVLGLSTAGVPNGYAAMLTLDETVEFEADGAYKVQLRSADGLTSQILACKPYSPSSQHLLLPGVPEGVAAGDGAVVYLASQEVAKVLVSGVKYGTNYATTLTAVDYDARVLPYWQDPPTDIISEVTGSTYDTPATPVVSAIVSTTASDDTDDAGIRAPVVHIGLGKASGYLATEVA